MILKQFFIAVRRANETGVLFVLHFGNTHNTEDIINYLTAYIVNFYLPRSFSRRSFSFSDFFSFKTVLALRFSVCFALLALQLCEEEENAKAFICSEEKLH